MCKNWGRHDPSSRQSVFPDNGFSYRHSSVVWPGGVSGHHLERGGYAKRRIVGGLGRFLLQPVHDLGRLHGTR